MATLTFSGALLIAAAAGSCRQDATALPARLIRGLDAVLRRICRIREFTDGPECLLRISAARADCNIRLAEGIYVLHGSQILDLHLWNEHLPRSGIGLGWGSSWRRRLSASLSMLADQLAADPSFKGVVALRASTALVASARIPKLLRVAHGFGFEPAAAVGDEPRRGRLREFFEILFIGALAWAFNAAALRRNGLGRQFSKLWISRYALEVRYGQGGADRGRFNRQASARSGFKSGTADTFEIRAEIGVHTRRCS